MRGLKGKKEESIRRKSRKAFRIAHDIPASLKVLLVYTGIITLFYLLLVFISDKTLFFGLVLSGTTARFIHFLFFLLALMIVYGIAYKKHWCYYLCMFGYSICILNSIISVFFLGIINDPMITSLYSLIIPFFLITLVVNILTLWYVHEKRLYFMDPFHEHKKTLADKVFIYSIFLFYFVVLMFIAVLCLSFVVGVSDDLSEQLKITSRMEFSDAQAHCEGISSVKSKDLCFLSVVYMNKKTDDIYKLCSSINSGIYRFTCYRVVEG